MSDNLTTDEIRARYDSEWVLIEDPETDESHRVTGRKVRYHSHDRDDVYRKIAELDVARSAVVFAGSIPEDMEFLLVDSLA
jgi:hypothetical protein